MPNRPAPARSTSGVVQNGLKNLVTADVIVAGGGAVACAEVDDHGVATDNHVEAAVDAEGRVVKRAGLGLGLVIAHAPALVYASQLVHDLHAPVGGSRLERVVLFEDPDDLRTGVYNFVFKGSYRTGMLYAGGSPSGDGDKQQYVERAPVDVIIGGAGHLL